jgi:hypothetical protein
LRMNETQETEWKLPRTKKGQIQLKFGNKIYKDSYNCNFACLQKICV